MRRSSTAPDAGPWSSACSASASSSTTSGCPTCERIDWLADSAVGVSLHHRHLETEFAFRTRILDYLWAGLPVICSEGDSWSAVVEAHDLGRVVGSGDVVGVARALDEMTGASSDQRREMAERARRRGRLGTPGLVWRAPLLQACAEPRHAADRRVDDDSSTALSRALTRLRRVAGAP